MTTFAIPPVNPDNFIPNRFKGKTMLVTGGTDGIGRATAIRAAREGANVVAVDKKVEALYATVASIKAEPATTITSFNPP